MTKCLPLSHYRTASVIALMLCLASQAIAADGLSPRAEVNVRAGTERSILMTEFWAPLAQQSDRVLYGDLRLMGDDGGNREGNLGFGYRQILPKTNSVLGANAWIDRRRTENGNNFHQITLGIESLGETVDIRANGYIQLNGSKSKATPNIGSATPYLAGSGIFFDTNGSIVEEPQHGFDGEIGYRLPIFQKHIDATRVYAGGYHFFGDTTDNTTGFRFRTEAQVNSIFSVGARFQYDEPRGSQGFLEATLRFPFKSKKLFQEHGLKSRLDESPERDIDIITGTKVDTGLMKPVLNASGNEQRILYVDNTNTDSGDGTKDNPFKTLVAAQAALQANDILYINRGDGTFTGMDQGITIDKANVQLVGSGTSLNYNGYTLIGAGLPPVITNMSMPVSSTDLYVGNGVTIVADNALISGITVSGAKGRGVFIAANAVIWNSATVHDITTVGNGSTGVFVLASNGGTIDKVHYYNNISNGNLTTVAGQGHGLMVQTTGAGSVVRNYIAENNSTNNNAALGVVALAAGGSTIGSVRLSGNTSNGQIYGIYGVASGGGAIKSTDIFNNNTSNNSNTGIFIQASTSSRITNANVYNNTSSNNTSYGVFVQSSASEITNAVLSSNTLLNNANVGIFVQATNIGQYNSVVLQNNLSSGNSSYGIFVNAQISSQIGSLVADRNTSTYNRDVGINVYANTASQIGSAQITDNISSNNTGTSGYGIFVHAESTASIISQANLINNTVLGNSRSGAYLYMNNGAINAATISGNKFNSNLERGLYISATTATSVANNIVISNNDMIGNTLNGAYLLKSNASAVFNVDFGGGLFNSTGQNRIFGNIGNDLNIDRAVFSAANNWWNNNGSAPTRVTTTNGGSATYLTPLATDPRP